MYHRKENGLPHQCAHWFAMTCRRKGRCFGCKNVVRNDMLKVGRCARVQGRFPAAPRQCPGIVRTGGKFLHVIARSEATWQSASPAAAQSREQRLRRIRGSATDLPKVVPTGQVSMRGERIATPVCALARNDMQKEGRVRGCKGAPRNDMLKFAACQRLQGRNDMR